MNGGFGLSEAAILGFSSGPACLISCGPILLPWLAAERRRLSETSLALGEFLAGRLGGYLLFGAVVWWAGVLVPLAPRARAGIFGAAHIAVAGALVWYILRQRRGCRGCSAATPLGLGFLTGINLCAPFAAAAVRAAQTPALLGAVGFFAAYFVGTTVWFLPALGVASLRRLEPVAIVARYTLGLFAAYYAYIGMISLLGSLLHG